MGRNWPGYVPDLVIFGGYCNLSGGTAWQAESGAAAISGHHPEKTEYAQGLSSGAEYVGWRNPDL